MSKPTYKIIYRPDEIAIVEQQCYLDDCPCKKQPFDQSKCVYTVEQVRKHVARYYEARAFYVRTLTDEQFVKEMESWR